MEISYFAPAKINLSLLVGKPNLEKGEKYGFHPLQSLVGFCANVGDEISLELENDLHLSITGEFSYQLEKTSDHIENNLVFKAAKALRQYAGSSVGARICLTKNLPIASGLGGGSTDAATTLLGLCKLWELEITNAELFAIAQKLGSDVPICLSQKPGIMALYGEKIDPAPLFPNVHILLANPLINCPTAPVYAEFDRQNSFSELNTQHSDCENIEQLVAMLTQFPNCLEPAACHLHPEISELMHCMASTSGQKLVRMSGSGATCFAIFENQTQAHLAKKCLDEIYSRKNLKIWSQATLISGNLA